MQRRATKVLKRVQETPPIRFFDPREANLLEVIVAHILPQDDREASRRIPIVPRIDERLHKGQIPGLSFSTMPPTAMLIGSVFKAIEKIRQSILRPNVPGAFVARAR